MSFAKYSHSFISCSKLSLKMGHSYKRFFKSQHGNSECSYIIVSHYGSVSKILRVKLYFVFLYINIFSYYIDKNQAVFVQVPYNFALMAFCDFHSFEGNDFKSNHLILTVSIRRQKTGMHLRSIYNIQSNHSGYFRCKNNTLLF